MMEMAHLRIEKGDQMLPPKVNDLITSLITLEKGTAS
jgi:hypothetical protein